LPPVRACSQRRFLKKQLFLITLVNLLAWLDAIGRTDAAPTDFASNPAAASTRRAALARLGRAALAATPLVATTTALAGPPPRVTSVTTDSLNLLLRVAYPQRKLINDALTGGTLSIPGSDRTAFEQHRAFLDDLINRLTLSVRTSGEIVEPVRNYDFTGNASAAGGGPLAPFTSYADFLLLMQVFSDTLSRVALSLLTAIAGSTVFTELAGQILGTASRLAADARLRRQANGVAAVRPWIVETEDPSTLPPLFTTTTKPYEGENSNTVFGGILQLDTPPRVPPATTPLPVLDPVPANPVLTAAFDQPLTLATVNSVVETLPQKAVTDILAPFVY
jgi:hypothetical protein